MMMEGQPKPIQTSFTRDEISNNLLPMYGDNKLYIDSFEIKEKGKKGTAKFRIRPEDCDGHFSKKFDDGTIQLFRGVDQIEAAAQALGLVFLTSQKIDGFGVFSGIEKAEFKGMVFPGQEIELNVEITSQTPKDLTGKCTIKAEDRIVTTIEGINIAILPNRKLAKRIINSQRPKTP